MDLEPLLQPAAADAPPCGPDLEYDAEFMALDAASRGKPEQVFGETVVPAEEPDWNDVRARAVALFTRTKDLRVAMTLLRALTRTEDLAGFASGLALLRELLGRYWQDVHPRLDAEDHDDPAMRLSALAALESGVETVLRDLRSALVVPSTAHGRVSVRDVLLASGRLAPMGAERVPSATEIEETIRAGAGSAPRAGDAAAAALEAASALQSILAERVGGHERAPDLGPLLDTLRVVADTVARATGIPAAAPAPVGEAPSTSEAPAMPGEIRSRDDAMKLLDKVCVFLERTEPANPAPLLIRRAQRLMTKSFVEIIEDLAPESLGQIRTIAGIHGE